MTDEKVFPGDPEAATYRTNLQGWVDREGRYYGADEGLARWSGATHVRCQVCGTPRPKTSYCQPCWRRKQDERWAALPEEPWNGEDMVYSDLLDIWSDDMETFYEEYEAQYDEAVPSEAALRLQHCRPVFARPLTSEVWLQGGPEDMEDLPQELQDALDQLNDRVEAYGRPLYWETRPAKVKCDDT